MAVVLCALALLSGVIGAGFASGREIARFFAGHGAASGAAVLLALLTLYALFLRLPAQLEKTGCTSLLELCRARFGRRLGSLCAGLFFLLQSVTGGAMLAACAELFALMMRVQHAYGMGMALSLLLGALLCWLGIGGLALPGALLTVLLPTLLLRLYALPAGEACFFPAMAPDLPVRAAADGVLYGALNAAMLCGALPMLLSLQKEDRRRAALLFTALFGALLLLGAAVCRRHLQAVWEQPLPFVALSRELGPGGYLLVALCMYVAALSTLCAMLSGLSRLLPVGRTAGTALSSCACLLFAMLGFGTLVQSGYPVLGALCAALMALLCLPMSAARRA
ncbi:MAG: hypothetical protein Q4F18_03025 [Clostridia bacterium]|nr:hypothetical protein [Clostridia bacterium]